MTHKKGRKEKAKQPNPPRRKITWQALDKENDILARYFCKKGKTCVACKVPGPWNRAGCPHKTEFELEWCHIVSRGVPSIKHDPMNCVPMCNIMHRFFTIRPTMWAKFIELLYPGRSDLLEDLETTRKGKTVWYEHWNTELRRLLTERGEDPDKILADARRRRRNPTVVKPGDA